MEPENQLSRALCYGGNISINQWDIDHLKLIKRPCAKQHG
uniref:Uncharacterized protein n=1 Tax=Anguilla anguilla TaxID=7936 RepID=A0A0E9U565_ANGAN